MDLGLKDKVAVVTGTGSQIGFGKAVAVTLAEEGCDVVGIDIDGEGAEQTAAEVRALGRKSLALKADISNRTEVDVAVNQTLAEFGKIDILVNNAGISIPWKNFVGQDMAKIEKTMSVNFYGQMNLVQAIAPHMISRKYGKIVNFSGGQGTAGNSVYAASKGAVDSWSLSLARELAPQGVHVNIFLPPPTETNLGSDHMPANFWDNYKKQSPLGRMCTTVEGARVIAFMVSDANSCMVGQLIKIGF